MEEEDKTKLDTDIEHGEQQTFVWHVEQFPSTQNHRGISERPF